MARFLVARLHELSELDFLLCREEGNMPDFLEVHTDRVVEADTLGNGEVDLDLFFFFSRLFRCGFIRRRGLVYDVDTLVGEPLVHIVHFVGGHILFLECVDQLAVCQRAAVLFALCKQAFNDFGARRLFLLRPLCHNAVLLP